MAEKCIENTRDSSIRVAMGTIAIHGNAEFIELAAFFTGRGDTEVTGLAFFLWPDHALPGVANLCRAHGADALTALNLSPVVRCSTALDTRARCEAIGDECVRNFVRAKESLALRKAAGDEKTGAMRETRARRLGEFLTDTIEVEVYDWRGK